MITVIAKFIGEDGSLGFKHGVKYKLSVSHNIGIIDKQFDDCDIIISRIGTLTNGVMSKDNGKHRCIYKNIVTFLENWTEIANDKK